MSIDVRTGPLQWDAPEVQIGSDCLLRPSVSARLEVGEASYAIGRGVLVWVPSKIRHRLCRAHGEGVCEQLRIRRSAFAPGNAIDQLARDSINRICSAAHQSAYQLSPQNLRTVLRYYRACFQTESLLQRKGLVCLLLEGLANGLPASATDWTDIPGTKRITVLLDHVKTHFHEACSVPDALARTGLSRTHFHRAFRHVTGTTYTRYVNRQRVSHAALLLRTTSEAVLAIAFSCGFKSVSRFYQVFAEHMHQSPQAYRSAQQS